MHANLKLLLDSWLVGFSVFFYVVSKTVLISLVSINVTQK